MPASTRIRLPGSTCSECRRRHQKCISKGDGPCLNCQRRYPPVLCAVYKRPDSQCKGTSRKYPSRAKRDIVVKVGSPPPESGSLTLIKTETPKAFGGLLSAVNACNIVPVEPTSRNTELFQLFLDRVIPRLSSIDGIAAPSNYSQTRIPWMIQSPLMPNIAILMASFAQGMERGEDVNRRQETLALKVKALALTNEFLAEDFSVIGNDAMLATIHLASLEYVWGHEQSTLSHLRGLKEMVRLKGGFAALTDRITGWVIIMLDFEVAIRHERPLIVLPPSLLTLMSQSPSTPTTLRPAFLSPLHSPPNAFTQNLASLSHSLDASTAEILDDISFLISAINSTPPSPAPKIRGTASWLLARLEKKDVKFNNKSSKAEPSTDTQIITQVITLTALILTHSITHLLPLSTSYTTPHLADLFSLLSLSQPSSLKRWSKIPGVFFWVLLVACPAAEGERGMWLRSKMAATRIVLALEDYGLPFSGLRGVWGVQRWIEGERGKEGGG